MGATAHSSQEHSSPAYEQYQGAAHGLHGMFARATSPRPIRSPIKSLGAVIARKPVTVGPEESLSKVARLMEQENVGAIVIAQQDRPVGIITDRDLALSLCLHGAQPRDPVHKFMTSPVDTISDDQGIYNTTMKMMELAVRRLPGVDEEDQLVGMVSLDDLLSLLSRELRNVADGVHAEAGVL